MTVPVVRVFSLREKYLVYRISASPIPKSLKPHPISQSISSANLGPRPQDCDLPEMFLFSTRVPLPSSPGRSTVLLVIHCVGDVYLLMDERSPNAESDER